MRFGLRTYWLFQAVGWGSFVLIHLFFNWSLGKLETPNERWLFFGRIGVFIWLGVILTHLMRAVILRLNLLQKKLEKQILRFILLTLVFSFISSVVDILVRQEFELLSTNEKDPISKQK